MNRLEFKKVMDVMNIHDSSYMHVTTKHLDADEVYSWNGFLIWCADGYTTVEGKIPLEVANRIYKKYPKNQYGIRVQGNCCDENPAEWAHNGYLSCYHIDTIEGLIIFLTEMEYYLIGEKDPKEAEERYQNLLAQVITKTLEEANPTINAYDWMQRCTNQKDMYNSVVEKDKKSELWSWIRNLVSEFDKAVNPYINPDIELDDVSNYINDVEIGAYKSETKDGEYCELGIRERDGEELLYMRHPEGFIFRIIGEYMGVYHMFVDRADYASGKGEIIRIEHYGSGYSMSSLELNLTNKKAGEGHSKRENVTIEQLGFIADELGKAIERAKKITIDKMAKKGKEIVK